MSGKKEQLRNLWGDAGGTTTAFGTKTKAAIDSGVFRNGLDSLDLDLGDDPVVAEQADAEQVSAEPKPAAASTPPSRMKSAVRTSAVTPAVAIESTGIFSRVFGALRRLLGGS